jgi:hypothetical protein
MPIMTHSKSEVAQTEAFGKTLWKARRIALVSWWLVGKWQPELATPPSFNRPFISEKNCWV